MIIFVQVIGKGRVTSAGDQKKKEEVNTDSNIFEWNMLESIKYIFYFLFYKIVKQDQRIRHTRMIYLKTLGVNEWHIA